MSKHKEFRVYYAPYVPVSKYRYYEFDEIHDALVKMYELAIADLDNSDVTDNVIGIEEYDEDMNDMYDALYVGREDIEDLFDLISDTL